MKTIVIVTGEREWVHPALIHEALDEEFRKHWYRGSPLVVYEAATQDERMHAQQSFVLRHGVGGMADYAANDWARINRVTVERYPAEWRDQGGYNASAGPLRNKAMAAKEPRADVCLAFWSGKLRRKGNREFSGTLDMIEQALQHGIAVRVTPPPPKETP